MKNNCDTDDIRDLFYNPDLAIPYKYIQTKEELLPHVRKIRESKVLGLDTETTGLCPFRNTIRLIQVATGLNDPVLVIDLFKISECYSIFKELFLTDAVKVFHNTSFDWNMFKSHNIPIKGNIFDTMIAGQILDCGIHKRGFKLSDMMKKYLNIIISKEQQRSDWSRDDLTPSQLYYAAKDAYVLLQLREVMKKKLIQEDLVNIASIEFRAIPAVADITYNGIYLDKDKWKELTNKYIEEEHILKAELVAFIGDGINLDSPAQLIQALIKKGINISDTNNESMVLALDRYPQLQTIINYRKVTKALTSFLYPMLEWVNPITNRIHPSYFQIGGRSGRFSCGSPNFQQVPRKREFRECFKAEFDDTTLVLSDFCLAAGTKITTNEGLKCIENINAGDKVLQEDGTLRKVIRKFDRGIKAVNLITTELGYSIVSTINHRFRVINKEGDYVWKEIRNIDIKNDYIVIQPNNVFNLLDNNFNELRPDYTILPNIEFTHPNNVRVNVPDKLNSCLAEFMGIMSGNGSLHSEVNSVKWHVNKIDSDLNIYINVLATKLFNYNVKSNLISNKGVYENAINSIPLFKWLLQIGYAKNKLPDYMFSSTEEIVTSWLRGYFETDGSVNDRISCSSSRPEIIHQIQLILLHLGIVSNIRQQYACVNGKTFLGYVLDIKAKYTKLFSEKIGFLSNRKKSKLQLLCGKTGKSTTHGSYPNLQNKIKKLTVCPKILKNAKNRGDLISVKIANDLKINNNDLYINLGLNKIVDWNQVYTKIQSIDYISNLQCYDLEVDNTHTFIANGFISHNSQIELRVGAEISGDPIMIKAYNDGEDLHKLTASLISGKDMKDVTKEERQCGKPVNFGLIFGMSAPTLCNYSKMNYGVDMTIDEAYNYRNRYFNKYKGLLRWHVMQKYKAQKEKETTTLTGRKRRWLNTPSITEVYNTPVQGTAVDIIKIAFTNILENLKNTSGKLIGSVHDEIELECKKDEAEHVAKILQKTMIDAGKTLIKSVPIEAEYTISDTWADK